MKTKRALDIFKDAYILLILFIVILLGFMAFRALLYPDTGGTRTLTLRVYDIPRDFRDSLSVGDVVFDSITKRRLGEISELEVLDDGGRVEFIIRVEASALPRGALRTKKLWFRWEELYD